METSTPAKEEPGRRAAVGALAIVGFIALILIGIGLAIYTARYLPELPSKLGGGAVSLSSIFHRSSHDLEVVTSTTTLPFEESNTTLTATTSLPKEPATNTGSAKPAPGPTATTYVTITTTTTVQPYGKPDLTVDITATGYCSSDNPSSFHKSSNIDDDRNGGVQFTVKNIGTNVTGRWDFEYNLPTSATQRAVTNQRSLNPGDAILYTICFEKPRAGDDREISVEVDSGRDVDESNERNNEDSVRVDIDN